MTHTDDNGFKYYPNLEEANTDGYIPVKATSILFFYQMDGRKSILARDNLVPLADVLFLILGSDDRYYLRTFRNWSLNLFYFYYNDKISHIDEVVESLRSHILDGRVWLLYTKEMIQSTKKMLERVYKAKFVGEGTIDYKSYIEILDLTLRLEEYKKLPTSLVGHKTVIRQFEDQINDLWRTAYLKNN